MSVFTKSELDYLAGAAARRLARIATVGRDGAWGLDSDDRPRTVER